MMFENTNDWKKTIPYKQKPGKRKNYIEMNTHFTLEDEWGAPKTLTDYQFY